MIAKSSNPGSWLVMFSVSVLLLIVNMDFTIVNMAIAPVAHDFHSSLSLVKWIVTGYAISSGIFMTIGGRLGDRLGLKSIYLIGICIFVLFSFLCALSSNITLLIVNRIFQGIGTALSFPLVFAFITISFDDKSRALALGIGNAIAGFTLAIGPTIGGLIIQYLSWRWFFYINVPLGLLAFGLAWIFIKINPKASDAKVDLTSSALFIFGMALLMLGINNLGVWPLSSWQFIMSIVVGVIVLTAFVVLQFKLTMPLLDVELLTHFKFLASTLIRFFLQYVFFALLLVLAIYFQNIHGFSSLLTGILLLVMTASYGFFSFMTGMILPYFSTKKVLFLSSLVMIASCVLLLYYSVDVGIGLLCLPLFLFGLSSGVTATATETVALCIFPAKKSGAAAGLFFTVAILSGAVGAALSTYSLVSSSQHAVAQVISSEHIVHSDKLYRAAEGSLPLKEIPTQLQPIVAQSFKVGFNTVMWTFIALTIVSLLFIFLLPKNKSCNDVSS